MEIRIYEDHCLSCSESNRFDVIYWQAKKHRLKVNRRRVYVFPELKEEAEFFRHPMPFIELNGNTIDFYTIGTNMLTDTVLGEFIKEAKNEHTD